MLFQRLCRPYILLLPTSFWAPVCKMICPMLSDRCPVCCDVGILWPIVRWQSRNFRPMCTVAKRVKVGLGPGHIVLDGDPAPPKGYSAQTSLQFSARVCCGQTAGWIKMPLGTEVDLDPGQIVYTAAPLFSAHVYCGQTVAHLSYC